MKKSTFAVLVSVFFLCVSSASAEQVNLVVGSGGEGGTYYPLVSEMAQFCDSPTLKITHHIEGGKSVGGSIKNLRNLLNNKIMAGIVQNDVANLEKMKNVKMKRIVALFPLHQEQVHVLVPLITTVEVRPAKKGKFGGLFGAEKAVYAEQENPINNMAQLAGKRVASWGGSVTTDKVMKLMGDISFEIVPTKDRVSAMMLLDTGKVDAVLAVVGAPAKWVEELPKGKYKLLGVTKDLQDKLNDVYDVANVSYDNMGKTGQSLNVFGVDAMMFTRVYRTPKMLNALAEFKTCVREKIFEIQDTPGTHPVWQSIDPTRPMKWDNVFEYDGQQ